MTSYCRAPLTFAAHQKPTVGDSKFSAVIVDHMGWLLCDGRSVKVADFQFLFNVIGYSFGGSGNTFRLPCMFGKVPGAVSSFTTSNGLGSNFTLGQTVGEYVHQLTYPEMPSHNHGVAAGDPLTQQLSTNNSTSIEYTGLTVVLSSANLYDPGHHHSYDKASKYNSNAYDIAGDKFFDSNTGTETANAYTLITDLGHIHDVNDPGHAHTLNPAGLDNYHNNMQPTLFMGNMFIYSGLYNFGTFPYTSGQTIQ